MVLGKMVYSAEIQENPGLLDEVEDPYVFVRETIDQSFSSLFKDDAARHKSMVSVITLMYERGWETVNISFNEGVMVAFLKNPRVKRSPEGS